MARSASGPVLGATWVASGGLAVSLFLTWRHAHPSFEGACGVGTGCDRALRGEFAEVFGVPLAWWGTLYFLAQWSLGLVLIARPSVRVLRAANALGLLGVVAAGLLLYVQFGVVRTFCLWCTLAVACAGLQYVLLGRAAPLEDQPGRPGLAFGALLAGLLLGSLGAAGLVLGERGAVVARIDGDVITQAAMDREMRLTLHAEALRTYRAKRNWLGWKIENRVLGAEAGRRGISLEALLEQEVDAQVHVTEDEIDAWLAREPEPPSMEQRRRHARTQVLENKRRIRRAELTRALQARHRVEVLLEPPRLPQVSIDLASAHRLGPDDAPVSLVVFSEFECPHCARLAAVLARIRETHGDRVQIAFLHCPLEGHPRSLPAARAAECAHAQDRFWAFHDRLFAHQDRLGDAELGEHAKALGLDPGRYASCLEKPEAARIVLGHARQAQRLGITSVPSLFLNGRLVGGSVAYPELDHLVTEALSNPWSRALPGGQQR